MNKGNDLLLPALQNISMTLAIKMSGCMDVQCNNHATAPPI